MLNAVLKVLISDFNSLFDFALNVRELKSVILLGKFCISSDLKSSCKFSISSLFWIFVLNEGITFVASFNFNAIALLIKYWILCSFLNLTSNFFGCTFTSISLDG